MNLKVETNAQISDLPHEKGKLRLFIISLQKTTYIYLYLLILITLIITIQLIINRPTVNQIIHSNIEVIDNHIQTEQIHNYYRIENNQCNANI